MTAETETADKPDYDSPWKEALERFFPEFLALLFPAIHAEIDWSKGRSVSRQGIPADRARGQDHPAICRQARRRYPALPGATAHRCGC